MRNIKLYFSALITCMVMASTTSSLQAQRTELKSTSDNQKIDISSMQTTTNGQTNGMLKQQVSVQPSQIPALNRTPASLKPGLATVRTENGMMSKQLNSPTTKIPSQIKNQAPAFKAAGDTTFFEGFEAWEGAAGADRTWLPADWSLIKTNPSTEIVKHWQVFGGNIFSDPTSYNKNSFYVEFDDFNESDEWLITPSISPKAADYLNFELSYNPFFMYAYDDDFEPLKDQIAVTLKIMASQDDGATWVEIFDVAKDIDYGEYTYANLYSPMIKYLSVDVSKYAGKNVKFAFRYVGKGGDSMGLDNVLIGKVEPFAMYLKPQGTYYFGVDENMLYIPGYVVPAFRDLSFRNFSEGAMSYKWNQIDNSTGADLMNGATVEHPKVNYYINNVGVLETPTLEAALGNDTSTYFYGAETENGFDGFVQAGGLWNVMNLDMNDGIVSYTLDDEGGFAFGTFHNVAGNYKTSAIANYFDKPAQQNILFSMNVFAQTFTAPAETQLTMDIIKVGADGVLAGILATSTIKASDVVRKDATQPYILSFEFSRNLDSLIIIEDRILCKLSGFNVPGVRFGAISSIYSSDYENNAYVYLQDNTSGKEDLLSSSDFISANLSLLFVPMVSITALHSETKAIVCDVVGGKTEFIINTTFQNYLEGFVEGAVDWIVFDGEVSHNAETGATTIFMDYQALPEGIAGRTTNLVFSAPGAQDIIITVTQGNITSIGKVNLAAPKVTKVANAFDIAYDASAISSVEVYNATGQRVASHLLPQTGTYALGSNLPNGVYIFKFAGDKGTVSVKVVK